MLFQGFSSSFVGKASVSVLGDLFETGVPTLRASRYRGLKGPGRGYASPPGLKQIVLLKGAYLR